MNSALSQLQLILQKEIELVQQFIVNLRAESEALATADHDDALRLTTEEKNRYADSLAQSGAAREESLRRLGYTADSQGTQSAMADHPVLQSAFGRLLELAAEAKELNAANGRLIDIYLKHTQDRLNTLRNLAGGGNLYDANGRARNFSGSQKGIRAG